MTTSGPPKSMLTAVPTRPAGTDFMLSHGYIHNDFDVHAWAAPEFLEKAASELLEEEWKKRSVSKLPQPISLDEAMHARLG
jgi:hypothetical protein